MPIEIGQCAIKLVNKQCPLPNSISESFHHGKNQLSVRIGGDYNVLPGLLALRAGLSYEADGHPVQYVEFANSMLQRVGLHGDSARSEDGSARYIGRAATPQRRNLRLDRTPHPSTASEQHRRRP
jgi:hypothetical protein